MQKLFAFFSIIFLCQNSFAAFNSNVSKDFSAQFAEKGNVNNLIKLNSGDLTLDPEVSVSKKDEKNNLVEYGVKANLGYNFTDKISGFAGYDVGNFGVNLQQRKTSFVPNKFGYGASSIGSKIDVSDSFNVKLIYSQQRMAPNRGIQYNREDSVKFGTVIKF
jgi:hypothetical protein